MATKASPGAYDCYQNAEPDEPMFVLLARDLTAPYLVDAWTCIRAGDFKGAVQAIIRADEAWQKAVQDGRKQTQSKLSDKSMEAQECAKAMFDWEIAKRITKIEQRLQNTVRS